ncbi:hypothetical protein D3C86_2130140 [compost metagenome]
MTQTGQLQDVWRTDRARREDRFPRRVGALRGARMLIVDARDSAILDQQPARLRLRQNRQIASPHGRTQEGLGRIPANAGPLVDVEVA